MKDLKICVHVLAQHKACDVTGDLERIAAIPGVGGLTVDVPTEVSKETFKTLKASASDLGLEIVQLCPRFWGERQWRHGQFSNPDSKVRQAALDVAKRVTDTAAYLEAELVGYRPVLDSFDYPFQVNHRKRLDDLVQGLAEWADYAAGAAPRTKLMIACAASPGRRYSLLPTSGQGMAVLNELNRPNLGFNLNVMHTLSAPENLGASIALVCRYGKLFHVYWNDGERRVDSPVVAGMHNFWEILEALFWLDAWGYEDWLGLTFLPDDVAVLEASISNLNLASEFLSRVAEEDLAMIFRTSDAVKVAQLQRDMLRTGIASDEEIDV